ncbi:hypothetical protein Tco_0994687 [Tanacetum coccineum]
MVNFGQLYAYLKKNENDANEVRAMRQRYLDPLALLANTYNPPPSYNSQRSHYNSQPSEFYPYQPIIPPTQQQIISSPQQQSYEPLVVQQQSFAPSTQPDLGFIVPSFLLTDDPITCLNKAMIKGKATRTGVINTVGDLKANQPRVIRCYNSKGEGHIAKMCTAKKRVKDSEWFKENMLLARA